jgi:PleD family two-component response regulator
MGVLHESWALLYPGLDARKTDMFPTTKSANLSADSPPASTAPHILVVDDDQDLRELLLEYLGKNDLRATTVASGRDMIAMFDREAIDLVVLDLRLPGEDGMQLARQLRERATVPIVR